jgi:hypothetical protein
MARHSPGTRLELGASVLAAARVVDTKLVDDRLARFRNAQHAYARAQAKVDAVEREVRAAGAQVASSVRSLKRAVDGLARALVADGHPLANPFRKFRAPTRGRLTRLPPAEAAEAVHKLAREVRDGKGVGEATLKAAEEVDAAAREIEERLAALPKLAQALCDAVAEGHARRVGRGGLTTSQGRDHQRDRPPIPHGPRRRAWRAHLPSYRTAATNAPRRAAPRAAIVLPDPAPRAAGSRAWRWRHRASASWSTLYRASWHGPTVGRGAP